jgi:hypothetical protein
MMTLKLTPSAMPLPLLTLILSSSLSDLCQPSEQAEVNLEAENQAYLHLQAQPPPQCHFLFFHSPSDL